MPDPRTARRKNGLTVKTLVTLLLTSLTSVALAQSDDHGPSNVDLSTETTAFLCADQADNRIRLVNPTASSADESLLWSYPAIDEEPIEFIPTDAKRVTHQGEVFILAAYHGRVRLIRFSDSTLVKDYPSYSSCHSAELLPDGAIVTANSNHGILRLHHSADKHDDLPLPYAHGVTWDKQRQCLWVLGDLLYRFGYAEGKLTLEKTYELPESPTGHDLFPLRSDGKLLVSNNDGLYLFDIATEAFQLLSNLKWIKSASQHVDGSIWISDPQRTEVGTSWQSDSVILVNPTEPKQRHIISGSKFYKARWWQAVNFSY